MKNLSIGKKIGLGFAGVLLILAASGGFSMLEMRRSATKVHHLSNEFVAELEHAVQLIDAAGSANESAVRFALGGADQDLVETRGHLRAVGESIEKLDQLAQKSAQLVKLQQSIGELRGSATAMVQAFDAAAAASEELDGRRKDNLLDATKAMEATQLVLDSQFANLQKEISEEAPAEKLAERRLKMILLTEATERLAAVRVANYRSQTFRDPPDPS